MNKSVLRHIKTILKHKKYVYTAMKDCGMPIQGLLHDLSKFSPTEFKESIKYYTGTSSPIEGAKKDLGYSDAWLHHKGRNKHHSQYWIDNSFGETIPCKMPYKYVVELICDTIGAGKAYMGDKWTKSSPIDYYNLIDYKSYYHVETREFIEKIYKDISILGWDVVANSIKRGIYEY